uniref:Uncharacterized protein n=1 Tax=viral metagenome TaxID=1070528 RepID=A0A6C0JVM8_9ZZZZ
MSLEWNLSFVEDEDLIKVSNSLKKNYTEMARDWIKNGDDLNHPIILDEYKNLRWKPSKWFETLYNLGHIDLNRLGLSVDVDTMRHVYKHLGISLSGYNERFKTSTN